MASKKTKVHLFISRQLSKQSPFFKLKKSGVKIIDKSFLKFKELSFSMPPPPHNAVFFYSARAIAAYLTKVPYDPNVMYGVMGPASNKVFSTITRKEADLIGTGDLEALSKQINRRWNGYRVLFPKAKKSMDSLAQYDLNIDPIHLNVYDNKVDKKLKIPDCDLLVFTSPLNFLGYLHQHKTEGKKIYAIGSTTATVIKEVTGQMPAYPEQPSEEQLYKLVLKDLKI